MKTFGITAAVFLFTASIWTGLVDAAPAVDVAPVVDAAPIVGEFCQTLSQPSDHPHINIDLMFQRCRYRCRVYLITKHKGPE